MKLLTQLRAEKDSQQSKIKELELDRSELDKQGSNLITKDGTIEQNQRTISDLNKNINQCALEKNLRDSKIKELNFTIEQKDKVIEGFSGNDPIRTQIRTLQKERNDLLNPWMISSKKDDGEIERKAKALNEQIIELQKSITCKS